jgi:hypothetical protein
LQFYIIEDQNIIILDYLSQHRENKVALKFFDVTDAMVRQISINPKQFPVSLRKRKSGNVLFQSTTRCITGRGKILWISSESMITGRIHESKNINEYAFPKVFGNFPYLATLPRLMRVNKFTNYHSEIIH